MAGLIPFNRNKSNVRVNGFDNFYNMLDDFFSDGGTWGLGRNLNMDTFKVDVQENEKEYNIEAELPGVKKDEIELDFNDGKLSISVSREENIEENNNNYIHRERRYGSMKRCVYLENGKADGIKAKLEDGVLKIVIEKQELENSHRKIAIE